MKHIEFFKMLESVTAGISTREESKEQVREALADKSLLVISPVQVHKDRVVCISEEKKQSCLEQGLQELVLEDTDGVISSCAGVALTTAHADCIPVFLYDKATGAMGMVHAGWKGTCLGIGATAAKAMKDQLGASFSDMAAAIGPGIAFCCFEVDEEVYRAFKERYPYTDEYAKKEEGGKYHLDLKGINARQLQELRIEDIQISPLCTVCGTDGDGKPLFHSFRRDAEEAGRMVAYIYR